MNMNVRAVWLRYRNRCEFSVVFVSKVLIVKVIIHCTNFFSEDESGDTNNEGNILKKPAKACSFTVKSFL